MKTAVLITHQHQGAASEAVAAIAEAAAQASWRLVASTEEHEKLGDAAAKVEKVDDLPPEPDLCLVAGGDGSILYALRRYAGTGVPVFGINFGTVGFLAAAERDELSEGLRRAFAGEFELMELPGLEVPGLEGVRDGGAVGLNDVSFERQPQGRLAELSCRIAGELIGDVRCDGLVVATPAGSTGYNLANQGPILAWGVEGYVVSFIAPHTLAARALVVAPADIVEVGNAAGREPVDVAIDGVHVTSLKPGESLEVRFRGGVGSLAQPTGSSFYRRIREKFGMLAH
jgi:NAD+ kinase